MPMRSLYELIGLLRTAPERLGSLSSLTICRGCFLVGLEAQRAQFDTCTMLWV